MRTSSARIIPAPWPKSLFLLAAALVPLATAQDLASLVKAYRENPTLSRRSRLQRFAAAHPKDQDGALARFALGVTALEQKDYTRAIENLKAAPVRLPKLEDYAIYYLASAELQTQDQAAITQQLDQFASLPVASPLEPRATVLRAKALIGLKAPADAIQILSEHYADLPQPDADLTLASAYRAASDPANAANYYQHVYHRYPDTDAAAQASAALVLLRDAMGASYPSPAPAQMLERGDKWLAEHEYSQARHEFAALVPELSGLGRDQARVRVGASDYLRGETAVAYRYLQSLDLERSEADAERLYYLAECQRKMNDDDGMLETVQRLGRLYPQSPWRLKALVSAAHGYLLLNRSDVYEPLFQVAYETFPSDPLASYCHWKVAWSAYIHRRHDALQRMREQLDVYFSDPRSLAAMYFLGRLAEGDKDFGAARAYFTRINELAPNFYYAVLARQRLADPKLVAAEPAAKIVEYLNGIAFPERSVPSGREPSPATRLRTERARLLIAAGFPDLAETELRFGARHDGQPHLLAMELARSAPSPYLGLRYMKSLAPDYLATPFEQMPQRFWELLFPIPYQKDLVRNCKLQNLDPYMVAALIRQESEFNPGAISRKNAYGLTQIMPATGRQLARTSGVRRFRTKMLFQPSTNLQLGARYLRSMLDQWGGKWEETLASYNAGKRHVDEWVTWDTFQEPAEFVETIPFSETRDYVQAVLRNAAMYRRLYGTGTAGLTSTDGLTAHRTPAKSSKPASGHANRQRSRPVS